MKIAMRLISIVALALVVVVSQAAPPAVPQTPAAVEDILAVQSFTLSQGYAHVWRSEKPTVRQGQILVLKVNPDLVYPRQTAEPVLYVGDQVAERVNVGYPSGKVVAIVPGNVDLEEAPIWFGTPALPERVNAAKVAKERTLADAAGIQPFAKEKVSAARRAGGEATELTDQSSLRRHAARLVIEHVPDEADRAAGMLAPRVEPVEGDQK